MGNPSDFQIHFKGIGILDSNLKAEGWVRIYSMFTPTFKCLQGRIMKTG